MNRVDESRKNCVLELSPNEVSESERVRDRKSGFLMPVTYVSTNGKCKKKKKENIFGSMNRKRFSSLEIFQFSCAEMNALRSLHNSIVRCVCVQVSPV